MWLLRLIDDRVEVGYFQPDGNWYAWKQYVSANLSTCIKAEHDVHYLNGGSLRDDA